MASNLPTASPSHRHLTQGDDHRRGLPVHFGGDLIERRKGRTVEPVGERHGHGVGKATLRDECLNEHLFSSLAATRRSIEARRTDYNTVRPHSSLGDMAPAEFPNRPRQGHEDTEANLSAA